MHMHYNYLLVPIPDVRSSSRKWWPYGYYSSDQELVFPPRQGQHAHHGQYLSLELLSKTRPRPQPGILGTSVPCLAGTHIQTELNYWALNICMGSRLSHEHKIESSHTLCGHTLWAKTRKSTVSCPKKPTVSTLQSPSSIRFTSAVGSALVY